MNPRTKTRIDRRHTVLKNAEAIRDRIEKGWRRHLDFTTAYINAALEGNETVFEAIVNKSKIQGSSFGSMLTEMIINRRVP